MRALIVGCGYVGLPLAAELAREGHEVFGLRRSSDADAELKAAGVKPLRADITDAKTLTALPNHFDWVVNCAATGGGSAEDYRQLYLRGTRNLLEWLEARSLKKFVYTSSTGVYGQTDGSLVTETSPTAPTTETAKILLEAETVLLRVACQIVDDGSRGHSPHRIPAVVLRAAGIYGPGRGYLLKQYLKGEARIEGDGGRILNMIHRDDLIGVTIAALKKGRPGEIYNAVDDEPVSQLGFFTWLAEKLGKPLPPAVPTDVGANRKRGVTSKKVSNGKLKMELVSVLKHPTFREGYTPELES